ncbi:hypothetical protein [Actinophytocola sediminis]
MRYDPDRTRLNPYPAAEPADPAVVDPAISRRPEPAPVPQTPHTPQTPPVAGPGAYEGEYVEEGVTNPDYRRIRTVNIVCTLINVVTVLFAIVLAVHIVLVLGSANMGNSFASFVDGWASGITLGLNGLFTPDNAKLATLLNEGLAALLWLAIGALLTYLIRRFALPGPGRVQRYRRVVR